MAATDSLTQCIAKLSKLIGLKWKDLAHHLGLQKTEIDAIEYNNLLNLEEQIFQFFDKWRQQQGQDASVEKLVEGLRAARLQEQLDSLGRAGLLLKATSADKLRSPSDSPAERELVRQKRLERFLSGPNKSDTSQESPSRVETSQAVGITSPTVKQELKFTNDPAGAVAAQLDPDRPFEVEDMAKVVIKGGAWYGVVRWIGRIDKLGDGDIAGLEVDDEVLGGHNGVLEGKKYFTCPSGHGLFLPVERLQRFNPDELQLPKNDGVEGKQKGVLVSDSEDQVEKDMDKKVAAIKTQSQSLEATLPASATPPKSSPDPFMALLQRSLSLSHDTGSSATASNDDDSDKQKVLAFQFPGDQTGLIIGKDGQNIREVEDATSTKIHIDKPGHGDLRQNGRAYIVGKKADCKRALLMILENLNRKIARHVAATEIMKIPDSRLCGKVIGRNGTTCRAIESLSGARVKIDQKEGLERLLDETATCKITGSAEQIEKAKVLIQEAMQGEDVARMATLVAVLSVLMKEFEKHDFKFDSKDLD